MAVQTRWAFEHKLPKHINRDPYEAEFFTGDDDDDQNRGKTDALVREVLQNSLDASREEGPVRVRFGIDRHTQLLPPDRAAFYLDGLVEHLDALGNMTVSRTIPLPVMDYLVIEDFGTHGLTGDPRRTSDPSEGTQELPESFYWFWRNIGRSAKTGNQRGRWGLGKTVFPSASRINTLFGLTIRSDDRRALLMGQAITKIHKIANQEYFPEGFFCDPERSNDLQLPFEASGLIAKFSSDFRLKRASEPGLSIVVPYPIGEFTSDDLARSVILHFFMPIMSGRLEVDIDGDGTRDYLIDKESIERISTSLSWKGSIRRKLHRPPPFELARWAVARQQSDDIMELGECGKSGPPDWSSQAFNDDGALAEARRVLADTGRIALRVPLAIEMRTGSTGKGCFDVFIQKSSSGERAEDYFVREGMTISGISTLGGKRDAIGLVVVARDELSKLLGDAEGPTHTEWGTGEARPEERYVRWKRRVTFVRNSISKLLGLLAPPPEEIQEDWLVDIFSFDSDTDAKSRPARRKRPEGTGETRPADPALPPRPNDFELDYEPGGFKIHSAGGETPPSAIRIQVAYDIPSGNPLSKWSPFDFSFDEGKRSPIRIDVSGARIANQRDNRLDILIEGHDFEIRLNGFDRRRDVYCKATASRSSE